MSDFVIIIAGLNGERMNGIFARTDEESIRRQTLLEHMQNTAEINSAFYFKLIFHFFC